MSSKKSDFNSWRWWSDWYFSSCILLGRIPLLCPPTFPMYVQAALVQGAEIFLFLEKDHDFPWILAKFRPKILPNTKIVFLCSPIIRRAMLFRFSKNLWGLWWSCFGSGGWDVYRIFWMPKAVLIWFQDFIIWLCCGLYQKAYAAAGLRAGVAIADMDVIGLLKRFWLLILLPNVKAQDISRIFSAW